MRGGLQGIRRIGRQFGVNQQAVAMQALNKSWRISGIACALCAVPSHSYVLLADAFLACLIVWGGSAQCERCWGVAASRERRTHWCTSHDDQCPKHGQTIRAFSHVHGQKGDAGY